MPRKIDTNARQRWVDQFTAWRLKKYKNASSVLIDRGHVEQFTEASKEYERFPMWLYQFRLAGRRGLYQSPDYIAQSGYGLEGTARNVSAPVSTPTPNQREAVPAMKSPVIATDAADVSAWIPAKAKGYVPFGNFNDIRTIIQTKRFYPTFVTGLSGNGKTMMIEQICAIEGRPLIRANITRETDEDDLIGGFRLINGETIWQNGPVITAMETGAILLLDEVDLGDSKLMCLQPVLEGKSIFIKKINKKVHPAPGFNVIATANTKGRGSDDGKFVGTNVMNEAFLERFSVTFDQDYPPTSAEMKILSKLLEKSGLENPRFVESLVRWAGDTRVNYNNGNVQDLITTRRLVHILEAFVIFQNTKDPNDPLVEKKAIELCLNRFDPDTRANFWALYTKIDATIRQRLEEEAKKRAEEEEAKRNPELAAKKKAEEEAKAAEAAKAASTKLSPDEQVLAEMIAQVHGARIVNP